MAEYITDENGIITGTKPAASSGGSGGIEPFTAANGSTQYRTPDGRTWATLAAAQTHLSGEAQQPVFRTADGKMEFLTEADRDEYDAQQAGQSVASSVDESAAAPVVNTGDAGLTYNAGTSAIDQTFSRTGDTTVPRQTVSDVGRLSVDGRFGAGPTMTATPGAAGVVAARPGTNARLSPDAVQPGVIGGRDAPSVSQQQLDPLREQRQQVLDSGSELISWLRGLPPPEQMSPEERRALSDRFFERGLAAANSVAASARGGAGAVAAARVAANQMTPQLAGQAAEQGRQESRAVFQDRLQAFNSLVGQGQAAAGAVQGMAQAVNQASGIEGQLAVDTAQVGLGVIDRALKEAGMRAEIGLEEQRIMGKMFTDVQALNVDWANLDLQAQDQYFDGLVQLYGIDTQAATAIKVAAKNNEKGTMDYIIAGIGAVTGAVAAGGEYV